MIKKVLIANRGEIAVRIIRACKELGLKTVIVYSEADKESLGVKLADEKVCIGKGPSQESYLLASRILSTCEITNADAIHPGYGFLSESADFADACEEMKIIFIGPRAETIRLFGDKIEAKKMAKKYGLKTIPGSEGEVENEKEAIRIANQIGYPILLKAAAGGGGKGIKLIKSEEELIINFGVAKMEAKNAFLDDRVYIEKYLNPIRHIEFQILGDGNGNVLVFPPRDCTIQFRHQKIIEKSPVVNIPVEKIREVQEKILKLCSEIKYRSAGTIEFLYYDDFYFMEVNTRIQVEHPVTEMITGVDLVKEQIEIAQGKSLTSGIIDGNGFAIEARLNACDPENNFLPSPGKIEKLYLPSYPFVRIDTHIYENYVIPPYYDSLLAKFIAWGRDREEARIRLGNVLRETKIDGIKTNKDFLVKILEDESFLKGEYYKITERLKEGSF
ncbi:MAG: acetyl-CoA carboxylase biotin carboxylase subunit [candidate division WOR-3 bacterium]|nr:acetyl-CoA carboxylase biotin carboxylase subunit [candidate division WOR-3 bacterium]MCX7836494.1 acetyl-CoA carboxylase biotin carboxylase subunit [candidate division WOR-3 bacterium]MDW8114527.1 acetyl-CoA carboxylase biotin carboxylase subunit [candidate division WOR-3 bacterium]